MEVIVGVVLVGSILFFAPVIFEMWVRAAETWKHHKKYYGKDY